MYEVFRAVGTYPLHPRVSQHLASAQAIFGIPDQKLRDEVFGT